MEPRSAAVEHVAAAVEHVAAAVEHVAAPVEPVFNSSSGQRLQSLKAREALSFSRGLAFSPSDATTLPHNNYAWWYVGRTTVLRRNYYVVHINQNILTDSSSLTNSQVSKRTHFWYLQCSELNMIIRHWLPHSMLKIKDDNHWLLNRCRLRSRSPRLTDRNHHFWIRPHFRLK